MERVKGFFQHISLYIIALAKWLCIGGGVGLIGGVVGAAFHIGVEQATELRLAQPWIIWLLPVGGVVIVGCTVWPTWRAGAPTTSSNPSTSARTYLFY